MPPGNVYKGAIDANSAIVSPCGQFYVYPNSPAGMSVLVDDAFNFLVAGTGLVLQPTAAAVSVSLTAPAINPYYGCIYWDSVANTFGVIYGAQATSPTILLPDSWKQVPLAAVLLTPGQVSVTASSIVDLRGCPFLQPGFASFNLAPSGNITQSLAGVEEAHFFIQATPSIELTLTNVRYFTRIKILWSSNNTLKIAASTPSGVALTVSLATPGAVVQSTFPSGTIVTGISNMGTTGLLGQGTGPAKYVSLDAVWSPENALLVFA